MAAELPHAEKAKEHVKLMDELLQEDPGRYSLIGLDLFEGNTVYKSRAASRDLCDISFLYKTPVEEAYQEEKEIIIDKISNVSFDKSLFIHASFLHPGKEQLHLLTDAPNTVRGIPVYGSVWIHGDHSKHALSLLFKNRNGKEVRVFVAYISFKGWRRIRFPIPGALLSGRETHKKNILFTGLLIESSAKKEASDFSILMDNLILITDRKESMYPGNEIDDSWP